MTKPLTIRDQRDMECLLRPLAQDLAAQAHRLAAAPLKPRKEQKPCDLGLFSDQVSQLDLVDMVKRGAPVTSADLSIPAFLIVPAKERREGWTGWTPRAAAPEATEQHVTRLPRTMSPEAYAILEAQEAARNAPKTDSAAEDKQWRDAMRRRDAQRKRSTR